MLEDTYLIFHTLYAYLTGKSRGDTHSGPDVLTLYL